MAVSIAMTSTRWRPRRACLSDGVAARAASGASALTRSHNLPVEGGYYTDRITFEWARAMFPDGLAYFIEHRDGFRTTMFLVAIRDFNYAGLRADNGQIISCQM